LHCFVQLSIWVTWIYRDKKVVIVAFSLLPLQRLDPTRLDLQSSSLQSASASSAVVQRVESCSKDSALDGGDTIISVDSGVVGDFAMQEQFCSKYQWAGESWKRSEAVGCHGPVQKIRRQPSRKAGIFWGKKCPNEHEGATY
jgi:hypothetical protein